MRTTITLDDHLLSRLKKRASDSGTSVSGLIERAVRLLLQAPAPSQRNDRFELVNAATGDFSWTPSASQAPSTNVITVRVTDDGPGNLSATQTATIVVKLVNITGLGQLRPMFRTGYYAPTQ